MPIVENPYDAQRRQVGRLIRQLRRAADISQAQLAVTIGVPAVRVSRLERGIAGRLRRAEIAGLTAALPALGLILNKPKRPLVLGTPADKSEQS